MSIYPHSLKIAALAFIFGTLSLNSYAQYSWPASIPPSVEISETNLTLVGSGFMDRKTGDSFALGCVNDEGTKSESNCTQIRHIFFEHATGKAFYVGLVYKLVGEDQAKTLKKTIKMLQKDFKKQKRIKNHNRNFWIYAGGGLALAPVLFVAIPTMAVLPIYAGAVLVWNVVAGLTLQAHSPAFVASPGGSTAFQNQDGWNWSSKPRKVSSRNFEIYRQMVNPNPGLD